MADNLVDKRLLSHIDYNPPHTGWMETPTFIRKGMYCHACRAEDLEALEMHNPRSWRVADQDWKLPKNWQQIVREGLEDRIKRFRSFQVFMDICVRCGACADKCHFFIGPGDPKNMPVLRAELLRSVYRYKFGGRILGKRAGARKLTEDVIKEWWYYFFQCSECRRCSVFCPYGIDTAEITIVGRELLNLLGLNINWSTYASEGGSFGLFTSYEVMKRLNAKIYAEARRLNVKWILGGECGHMWRVINQYMDTMNGPADFMAEPVNPITGTKFDNAKSTKMVHIAEFTADLIKHRKLDLDPGRNGPGEQAIQKLMTIALYMLILDLFFIGLEFFTAFYSHIPAHTVTFRYLLFGLHGNDALRPWYWAMLLTTLGTVILFLMRGEEVFQAGTNPGD